MKPTVEQLQSQIDDLQSQINALKSYATIPLDIGEAMKARILGQNTVPVVSPTSGTPATMTVTDTNGANPPVNYTVCAPFTKQLILKIGEITYIIPSH